MLQLGAILCLAKTKLFTVLFNVSLKKKVKLSTMIKNVLILKIPTDPKIQKKELLDRISRFTISHPI